MSKTNNIDLNAKVAPPDKAALILAEKGYPIPACTLRRWYKQGKIPGCFTGKRVLLNLNGIVQFLENGDNAAEPEQQSGCIRKVEV